jgi:hypothetical protein
VFSHGTCYLKNTTGPLVLSEDAILSIPGPACAPGGHDGGHYHLTIFATAGGFLLGLAIGLLLRWLDLQIAPPKIMEDEK